ncbi:MAG: hypothetical protein ACR2O5_00265 [Thiogranum sp.]
MAGFRVTVNGKELASVSSEERNIVTVQIHGDVIGEELAVIDVFGGLYEGNETDSHFIWVNDHEISSGDEVEITFCDDIGTSHRGKTIEELHPETEQQMGPWQPMEEIFKDLVKKPRLRKRFSFELVPSKGEPIHSSTGPNEYMFHCTAMWKWTKPEEARVSLTSNTLEGIEERTDGVKHAGFSLQYGQGVKLRVGT